MSSQTRLRDVLSLGIIFGVVCGALGNGESAQAGQTYLALGDSITFGVGTNDTATDISNGDRGYVKGYADYLAGLSGGVRPNVINLAVSGESSSSFFGNGVGLDGPTSAMRNTNYTGKPLPTQDALMLSTIQSQLASGNTISNVTISLGANDLFIALANGQAPSQVLATLQANELNLLSQIRRLLPATNLILLGYFDPYAPFANDPSSPLYAIAQASASAIPTLNSLIAADAAAFHAGFANLYTPFQGKELADTYVATGNVHPNAAGYALITRTLESVPEPSSLILVGIGAGLLPIAVRSDQSTRGRRNRATASL